MCFEAAYSARELASCELQVPARNEYRFHFSLVRVSVEPTVSMKITFSCLATSATAREPAELTTPNRKFTWSFWMYRLDRETSSWTFALESAISSSNFFPRTPPFALISLTASSAPCLHVIPEIRGAPR